MQLPKYGGMPQALLRWAQDFGPMFKFFLGRHTIVVINGASCRSSQPQCDRKHTAA